MIKRIATTLGLAVLAATGAAAAGDGVIRADGTLELSVNTRLVPTQADLDELREQLRRTQLALCGATDQLVRLTRVTVTRRPADEKRADIWWYPEVGTSNAGRSFNSGHLGELESKVALFGTASFMNNISAVARTSQRRPRYFNLTGLYSSVIAHELGHHILDVGDLYPEADRLGSGCGWGPGIQPSTFDAISNSIMQLPAQTCVNQDGLTHADLDPGLAPLSCNNDTFCALLNTATDSWTCLLDPRSRELSVDTNFDTLLAPWADGSNAAPAACPGPRPPTDFHVHARVRASNGPSDLTRPVEEFDATDEDTYNVMNQWLAFDSAGNDVVFDTYVIKYEALQTQGADKLMLIVTTSSDLYASPPETSSFLELARFALELDATGLVSINGVAVVDGVAGDGSRPVLQLGGTQALPFGVLTDGAQGQHTGSSALASGAAPITLQLHLENLQVVNYPSQFAVGGMVQDGNSAFFVNQARTGYVASRLVAPGGLPQQRGCTDADWCAIAYHPNTGEFEGSVHTINQIKRRARANGTNVAAEIAAMQAIAVPGDPVDLDSGWESFFQRHGLNNAGGNVEIAAFEQPASEPNTDLPTVDQCGPPGCVVGSVDNPCEVQIDFEDITAPEEFVIVLDKSGSMEEDVSLGSTSETVTRLQFAKAAARTIVAAFAGSPTNTTRVSVVSFDDLATQVIGPTQVAPRNGANTNPSAVVDAIDTVTSNEGFTGVGLGLNAGLQNLQTTSPGSKALVLLSDGQNNRPCECILPEYRAGVGCPPPLPGEVCDFNQLPEQAATNVDLAGVQLFTVPVGEGALRTAYALLADAGGGEMFDSAVEAEVIPNFMLAYIAFRGGQPILAKAQSTVHREPPNNGGARQSQLEELFALPVEPGAETLEVLLSVRESRPGAWAPNFELLDPQGNVVVSPSVGTGFVTTDDFFRLIRLQGPAAGEWTLRMIAPATPGTVSSLITAFVDNPNPDCLVATSKRFLADGEAVEARVLTSFGLPLHSGMTVTGELVRPDGSRAPLSFEADPDENSPGRLLAQVDPSAFVGRGTYAVEARCQVGSNAQAVPGEGDGPPNQVTVEPFERTGRAQFFVNAQTFAPPSDDDPDKDGIPTSQEPDEDLDGDGLPCWLDSDCDGDEVPDSKDPDPTDPLVTGKSCELTPPEVGCCVQLATCEGRKQYVVYGSEQVRVRNNAIVSPEARVAAGSGLGVELAAGAQTGTLHSVGGVFLGSDAHVFGDVLTSDVLFAQHGALVDGGVQEGASLALPDLNTFSVTFPTEEVDDLLLEPGGETFLFPGQYGKVYVKPGSSLTLLSGTYLLNELIVDGLGAEGGGSLIIEASVGPVFVYVRDALIFRGELSGSSGTELLVGYLGGAPAFVEAPFFGTVVAPSAELTIGPGHVSQTYVGSFFARSVLVRPDVTIVHQPFHLPWTLGAAQSGYLGGPPEPPAGEPIPLAITTVSDWGTGYCVTLDVTNPTASPTTSWSASFDLVGTTIVDSWNANFSGATGQAFATSNASNGVIAAGATFSGAGFCASRPPGSSSLPQTLGATATF